MKKVLCTAFAAAVLATGFTGCEKKAEPAKDAKPAAAPAAAPAAPAADPAKK